MKKKNIILALTLMCLSFPIYSGQNKGDTGANAHIIENGGVKYTIVGDRIMYQTSKPFDETINTFEAWINLPSYLANGVTGGVILGNYYNKPNGYSGCVNFGVGTNGNFHLYWNNGAFTHTFKSTDLRNSQWTHVALVRNKVAHVLTLYINGEAVETIDATLDEAVSSMRFGIGTDWNNWYDKKTPFYGKIRQITCYSSALTKEDIKKDMEMSLITQNDRPGKGLMANWYFTENWGVQDVIVDDAGNMDVTKGTFDCYVEQEKFDDYDYSFVAIPDIQAMTYYKNNHLDNFGHQIRWLKENKDDLKIEFVMFLGDMIESRYSTAPENATSEWEYVSRNMNSLYEDVPFTFLLGNHDYDNWCQQSRETTQFNKYLPYSKYSQSPYFGGAFIEGSMDNTYHLFNVGDAEYLVFALEYAPRQRVLNWVDRIISEHPTSRVIVTSHSIVAPIGKFINNSYGGPIASVSRHDPNCNDGEAMWNKLLSKHPNMFMNFSGHSPSDYIIHRTDEGEYGNKVHSVLVDFQGAMMTSKMNTLLLAKVNERNKTIHFSAYSPEFDAVYNMQNQYTFSFADSLNPAVGG